MKIKDIIIVLVILALFAALFIPNILDKRFISHIKRTQSNVRSIITAMKQYEAQYGVKPFGEAKETDTLFEGKQYDTLMELLTCQDGPDSGSDITFNVRKTRFLTPPSSYGKEGFVDSWGNSFRILIDTNYDNKVNLNGEDIEGSVIVYSCGENKIDDKGKKDDKCSWE